MKDEKTTAVNPFVGHAETGFFPPIIVCPREMTRAECWIKFATQCEIGFAAGAAEYADQMLAEMDKRFPKDEYVIEKPAEPLLAESTRAMRLGARIENAMDSNGIETIGQLCDLTEQDILNWPNIGEVSLHAIKVALQVRGLSLKKDFAEAPAAGAHGQEM